MVSDPVAALAQLEGVPSAVASARAAVDAVLRDRGMRQVSGAQSAAALVAGARASADLTGDVERWLPGALRLSTELVALSGLLLRSPLQALARAHTLVAYGQVPADALGRLRTTPGVAARMLGLGSLLTRGTTGPVAVLAAVAHAEIAAVAPFGGAADQIIARGVEHMVLISRGLDPRAMIVVEAGHLSLQQSYEAALAGYAEGGVPAVRTWLLHCAAALAAGGEASPLAGIRADVSPGVAGNAG